MAKDKNAAQLRTDYPDAWIPVTEGDTVEGTVTEISRGWSDQRNDYYWILRFETDDNLSLAFHAFHEAAKRAIEEKQPLPGERIKLTYMGEGKAKGSNNAPKIIRLRVVSRDPINEARDLYARAGLQVGPTPRDNRAAEAVPQIDFGDVPFE